MKRNSPSPVKFSAAFNNDKGTTVVEYGFILVLIVIIIIAAMQGVRQNESMAYSKVNSALSN